MPLPGFLDSLVSAQADLSTPAAANTVALRHPVCLCAALLVISSFHDFFELGGVLTTSSLFITFRGFAFTLVYGHRLRSTFFI